MRGTFFISIGLMAILLAGQTLGQSAFLGKDQSGTGVGLTFSNDSHTTGFGLGAVFSSERRTDVSVVVFTLSNEGGNAYGGGLGVNVLKATEDSDVLGGFPISVQCFDPPGRGGLTLTGSVGVSLDFPISTSNGTRFVFSMGASVTYVLSSYYEPLDRTNEVFQVSMGKTFSTTDGTFWLVSITGGYSLSFPNSALIGMEIGLLFPD